MRLADNFTLKELCDMGTELTISEKVDPEHELWLSDDEVDALTQKKKILNLLVPLNPLLNTGGFFLLL
ncbi:MAG: hypothetical protein ACI8UC_000073 [Psychromonas sp.]|jgi:hypothetical protein